MMLRNEPTIDGADESSCGSSVLGAQLLVASGPDEGRSVRLERPGFVIGTGANADLRLVDDAVGEAHVCLSPSARGIRIQDLGTSGGCWMGSVRIYDVIIEHSTSIVIGRTKITLSLDESTTLGGDVSSFGEAIGESAEMRRLFAVLDRAARVDIGVLVEGESGVGKDVLVRSIHARSARARGPFVAVDCGAISPTLIESELFGHARGAFTGAERERDGVFVQADGGTLFLDEIGELPTHLQPKLLRVLETLSVQPLGGGKSRRVDVRIIAATNKNLARAEESAFRRDLFYRLAVLRVEVPPLRERTADILPLARSFLRNVAGHEAATFPPFVEAALLAHPWPGNVRELKNVVLRYAALGAEADLFGQPSAQTVGSTHADLSHLGYEEARAIAIDRFEQAYLSTVLARADNVVTRAAQHAGVRRSSFYRMLRRIRPPNDTRCA